MWRIHILALFVSISSVAYFRHGASAKESHPSGTRSAWRRRKTPFESIQVEGGSTISIRVSSSVLDIGSRANNGFGKLFAEKDKGQSVQISVENGNHGITKNQLREYINKQGDSNEKDVNHRESPMVQQINENIKKQEEITMAEAPALMKMMLLSDSDYGMSMSMPPAGSPSELSTMNEVGGSSNVVPVTVPTINDGPSKNVGATVMPTVIIATVDNGDEMESSAPFSTLEAVTLIVVSIITVSFY